MGLGNWLRKTFARGKPAEEMVPFYDVDARRVVRIPVSELRPGAVQVRLQNTGEVVWMLPEQLTFGEVKHPEFDEDIRDCIRQIQSAFSEHRPLSFEEWEEGFRRDTTPEQEIAIWLHAADVYTTFANTESSVERRREIYQCIVTCMNTGPDAVWHVLRPQVLRRVEAEQVVNRFFGKSV